MHVHCQQSGLDKQKYLWNFYFFWDRNSLIALGSLLRQKLKAFHAFLTLSQALYHPCSRSLKDLNYAVEIYCTDGYICIYFCFVFILSEAIILLCGCSHRFCSLLWATVHRPIPMWMWCFMVFGFGRNVLGS